jgi:hypothetical protein
MHSFVLAVKLKVFSLYFYISNSKDENVHTSVTLTGSIVIQRTPFTQEKEY